MTGFLGDFVARVQDPGGGRGLVVSTVPLRSSLGGQGERPVDLSIRDQGSGFVPVNPVVATVIPKRSSDEVQVGEIGLRLPNSGSHAGRLAGGKVVYPNTEPDTDSTVTGIPGGIEEFSVLRSPNSPTELSFGLRLPAGAVLQPAAAGQPGGFDVVRSGRVLAHIPTPTASDAYGQKVDVRATASAQGLKLSVEHRGRDVAYPVSVDPVVGYPFNGGGRLNSAGWGFYPSDPYANWQTLTPGQGAGGWGYGLYTYQLNYAPNNYPNAPSDVGEWNYYGEFWRSSTAYVYAMETATHFYAPYAACRYTGIYSLVDGWEAGYPGSFGVLRASMWLVENQDMALSRTFVR